MAQAKSAGKPAAKPSPAKAGKKAAPKAAPKKKQSVLAYEQAYYLDMKTTFYK